MPRSRSLSPISSVSELSLDEGYRLVDGGDVYGRKWDPSNVQHNYVLPTTYQSIVITVNHAWKNPCLQTARNSVMDIASDLRPALSEEVDLAGAKMKIAATKLSVSVVKATRDFADSKGRKVSVPETRSGHSELQKDAKSNWQSRPHAFSATYTLATPNLHAVEPSKAEDRSDGSLTALEGPQLQTKRDEWKESQMKAESLAHRKSRPKDDGFENRSL